MKALVSVHFTFIRSSSGSRHGGYFGCAWFRSVLVKVSSYLLSCYQAENTTDGVTSKQAQTLFVGSDYVAEGCRVRQGIKQKVY